MKKNLSLFLVLMTVSFCTKSQIVNNWRGENRTGIYNETNLLKEWPAKGPEMLWSFDGLGKGFSSPAIDGEKLYITGLEGDDGFLFVFSFEGKLEKKVSYGKEVSSNDQYPGTRSTPTIAGNLLYLATSFGKLFCMDITTYKKVWEKDLFSDFDGKNIRWNFTENVLIDGDVIFVAPGGKKNNVVALNRHNGNLIWNSAGKSELSAYCSPLLINHNGRKMLITMMGENTLGLDATTGNVLWSFQYKNQHNIYPNTPIYYNDKLLIFSGYGKGSVLLQLNKEGTGVTQVWENTRVDPQMGGAVLIDGNIYTSGHRTKRWFCVDWESGQIKQEFRDLDVGVVIAAEGLLYAYTQKGELALLKPLKEGFEIISNTNVTMGTDQHWAHPVIHNGVLYVRHGNAFMAYDIRKK